MKKSTPISIKILIHLLGLLDANQQLKFKPNYFLSHSFSDYSSKRKIYYQSFYNLLRYKYLQRKLIKNVEYFEITKKGKYKALKYRLKERTKQKWDRKWRLIFFDIPQNKDFFRNKLRENLQLLGFKYLQKSVWVCPYNVRKELGIIVDYYNLHDYIQFAVIEFLENDSELKKKFNL